MILMKNMKLTYRAKDRDNYRPKQGLDKSHNFRRIVSIANVIVATVMNNRLIDLEVIIVATVLALGDL